MGNERGHDIIVGAFAQRAGGISICAVMLSVNLKYFIAFASPLHAISH